MEATQEQLKPVPAIVETERLFTIKNEEELIDVLTYASYATNRDNGMTHQQLTGIGIGDDLMLAKYERELQTVFP